MVIRATIHLGTCDFTCTTLIHIKPKKKVYTFSPNSWFMVRNQRCLIKDFGCAIYIEIIHHYAQRWDLKRWLGIYDKLIDIHLNGLTFPTSGGDKKQLENK
ncbi:hypothetical protein HanRHA438_Chr09g0400701 [Helianthus annuus]|uniref:Uncharacterized protein n=1 Tax=Helianthus annuus TaxID=4232 RepID=A0A9K3N8C6_HELAN|nr:hypothetical protein HanXRQr2_Chr09g0389211 [Helianthus annuus]KAJ0534414.1 hypothetical protein HanIR_Chr09g0419541 [Helianthus annuus]KAJ0888315.1 hypothetical protein HanRHA438_Chr09g0400701 [Helianthus annuus]KAJ0893213.1 hypothetical protein HanPSC8_Chr09g0375091 [Helianthus annuus]